VIKTRKSADRGHVNHDWLESYHTFSFAGYHDPRFTHFRSLRVINEDWVQPGEGFDTHPHEDMEIITYVLEGALEHKDSMGTGSVIKPREIQKMSAGTGVTHSEFNHSKSEKVHLLQIWILPDEKGLAPMYEQKTFSDDQKKNKLLLVGSRDGRADSIHIHQDVNLYASILESGEELVYKNHPSRQAWLQVVKGEILVNDIALTAGDGLSVTEEEVLNFKSDKESEFLLFDLG
jgi:redox-sensitive bicupin YhaK (pirin superfamily)